MKKKNNLNRKLLLEYTKISEYDYSCGKYDMPYLSYNDEDVLPDYLCLYKERKDYKKTLRTFVTFYQYDDEFDCLNGLFYAIYFNIKEQLDYYKERFKGVFGFISPDYTQAGDIHFIENAYRCFKARIVSIWLIIECNAVVIPNIAYVNERSKEYCFDGIEKGSIVAISAKGLIREDGQRKVLEETIKETVDNISPKAIVVCSLTGDNEKTLSYFKYATEKGIKVITPPNSLQLRNRMRMEGCI